MAVVTVDVADVVPDAVAAEGIVGVTVDVLGYKHVFKGDVAVVQKSQLVYSSDCESPMARFSATAMIAPKESLKKPVALHCKPQNPESTCGVLSSITLFNILAPASHVTWLVSSIVWFLVTVSC